MLSFHWEIMLRSMVVFPESPCDTNSLSPQGL